MKIDYKLGDALTTGGALFALWLYSDCPWWVMGIMIGVGLGANILTSERVKQ